METAPKEREQQSVRHPNPHPPADNNTFPITTVLLLSSDNKIYSVTVISQAPLCQRPFNNYMYLALLLPLSLKLMSVPQRRTDMFTLPLPMRAHAS
jgi:hypothetical protein